jgi:hypothetical protein
MQCLAGGFEFSALDPCVGDGAAFMHLLEGTHARRYGVEIDANRAEQARNLGIETLQAGTFDVRSPAEAFSLLYLNPPYDLEIDSSHAPAESFALLLCDPERTGPWDVLPQSRPLEITRLPSAPVGAGNDIADFVFTR